MRFSLIDIFRNHFATLSSHEPQRVDTTSLGNAASNAQLANSTETQRTKSSDAPRSSNSAPRHDYRYLECLKGVAPVPKDIFGKGLFQLLMAGGMTTFMVTFNGLLRDGAIFLIESHWMYPLILCISLSIRFLFANELVDRLVERFIPESMRGFRRSLSMSLLNVSIMAPIMGCIVTMLLHGPDGYFAQLASTLPLTAPVSLLVNLFIVSPAVKMLYHNVLLPGFGMRMLQMTQRYVTNWAGVFTS